MIGLIMSTASQISVSDFTSYMSDVLTWLFGTAFPAVTSAIVSNGIFLTVVILAILAGVIFTVVRIINAIIGKRNGGD